jgi:hypothetical protein
MFLINKFSQRFSGFSHLQPFQYTPILTTPVCRFNETVKENKKLISISPGGLKGFYMLGVSAFIKEHYSLDNYIFSGASAGAWTALFLTYKGEPIEFILEMTEETKKAITIFDMEYLMKYRILQKYKDDDFDLDKLFIGVTSLENMKFQTRIYSNFSNVEDAINCCIASSHIPYITGGFKNIYHNHYSFDGGFSTYPYIQNICPSLHITPSMWKKKNKPKSCIEAMMKISTKISDYTTLFSKDKYDYYELFDGGYNDAKEHKAFLDSLFNDS